MKVFIVEDEIYAVRRLEKMLLGQRPNAELLGFVDSVEDAVDWFSSHDSPDLIFMDIQLADGQSFDIFKEIKITTPVIFTTAYDQYTMDAFRVSGIDYLLKPVEKGELKRALDKFEQLRGNKENVNQSDSIRQILQNMQREEEYKQRFLVKSGKQFVVAKTDEIAWFVAEDGLVFLMLQNGQRKVVDATIAQIDDELNPKKFFRINRKMIVSLDSIAKIDTWFNSRLKLTLNPASKEEVLVSRNRVAQFKKWLGG